MAVQKTQKYALTLRKICDTGLIYIIVCGYESSVNSMAPRRME